MLEGLTANAAMEIQARMARAGIAPVQGDPLDDEESRVVVKRFLGDLWREAASVRTMAAFWATQGADDLPGMWEEADLIGGWSDVSG
jgi:hypothetical protein